MFKFGAFRYLLFDSAREYLEILMFSFNLTLKPLLRCVGTEWTRVDGICTLFDLFHNLLRTKFKFSTNKVKEIPCGNGLQLLKIGTKMPIVPTGWGSHTSR